MYIFECIYSSLCRFLRSSIWTGTAFWIWRRGSGSVSVPILVVFFHFSTKHEDAITWYSQLSGKDRVITVSLGINITILEFLFTVICCSYNCYSYSQCHFLGCLNITWISWRRASATGCWEMFGDGSTSPMFLWKKHHSRASLGVKTQGSRFLFCNHLRQHTVCQHPFQKNWTHFNPDSPLCLAASGLLLCN